MLSFLKSHNWDDAFLAGMRGACVVTGLIGTVGELFLSCKASAGLRLTTLVHRDAMDGEPDRGCANRDLEYPVRPSFRFSPKLTKRDRSEVVCLIPVLLSFFVGAPAEGERGMAWNAAMLFTGSFPTFLGFDTFFDSYRTQGCHCRALGCGRSISASSRSSR